MYYYIIYNSSIIDKGDDGKKYLTTLLYGSIAYILTHAYLSASNSKIVQSIKDYFWLVLLLDVGAMAYVYTNEDGTIDWQENINKLKNDIAKYTNDNPNEENQSINITNNSSNNNSTNNYSTNNNSSNNNSSNKNTYTIIQHDNEASDNEASDDEASNDEGISALNNMIDDVMSEKPFDDQYNVAIHKPDELKDNFNRLDNERNTLHDSFKHTMQESTTTKLPPVQAIQYDPKIDIKPKKKKSSKKSTPIDQLMNSTSPPPKRKNKNPPRQMTLELEDMIASDNASDSGSEIDLNLDEFENQIDL